MERKVAEGVHRKVQRKVEKRVITRIEEVERKVSHIISIASSTSATAKIPPLPSSDDDNQPALVRYARLKEREHTSAGDVPHRPGGPRIITSPPNPEKWGLKDTSVNVATAFHQAASDMQTYNSTHKDAQQNGFRNRFAPPPSRLNNTAGAGLRATSTQSTRRPVSKTASVHHVEA